MSLLLAAGPARGHHEATDYSINSCEEVYQPYYSELFLLFVTADWEESKMFRIFPTKTDVILSAIGVNAMFPYELIEAVRYVRHSETSGLMHVEFKEPIDSYDESSFIRLDLGLTPEDCWLKVGAAFQNHVPIEIVE